MSKIIASLAATALVATFAVSSEAEARGNARAASFSRPAAISRPAVSRATFAPRTFAPVRTAALTPRIGAPALRNLSPRNPIIKPPRLVNAPGLGNPFKPGVGKLPPGLGRITPPGLVGPPGLKLPPGLVGPPA